VLAAETDMKRSRRYLVCFPGIQRSARPGPPAVEELVGEARRDAAGNLGAQCRKGGRAGSPRSSTSPPPPVIGVVVGQRLGPRWAT